MVTSMYKVEDTLSDIKRKRAKVSELEYLGSREQVKLDRAIDAFGWAKFSSIYLTVLLVTFSALVYTNKLPSQNVWMYIVPISVFLVGVLVVLFLTRKESRMLKASLEDYSETIIRLKREIALAERSIIGHIPSPSYIPVARDETNVVLNTVPVP